MLSGVMMSGVMVSGAMLSCAMRVGARVKWGALVSGCSGGWALR